MWVWFPTLLIWIFQQRTSKGREFSSFLKGDEAVLLVDALEGFSVASNTPHTGTEDLFRKYQEIMRFGQTKTPELQLLNSTENLIVLLELQWDPCSCLCMSRMFHIIMHGWIFNCYSLFLLKFQQNSCSCLWMSLKFQAQLLSSNYVVGLGVVISM